MKLILFAILSMVLPAINTIPCKKSTGCDTCAGDDNTCTGVCKVQSQTDKFPSGLPKYPVGGARDQGDNCKCKSKYAEDYDEDDDFNNKGCKIKCQSQCAECAISTTSTPLTVCTACPDGYLLPSCKFPTKGWYIEDDTISAELQVVKACAPKCLYCKGKADTCTDVNYAVSGPNIEKCNGQGRNPETCDCIEKKFDNEGRLQDCEDCPANCKTCVNSNMCTECEENQNLEINYFSGQCECKAGFKKFDEDNGCQKCYMLSDVCVQKCPQNTVQNEQNYVCETLEYEMISNATLILILGILIGIIQIALCCFVYICLQRKHDIMEKSLFEEQMKIKQQRDHIYKNMESYNQSADMYSKSGTQSPFKARKSRSQADDSVSELSHSNLHSSQANLFQNQRQNNGGMDQSQIQDQSSNNIIEQQSQQDQQDDNQSQSQNDDASSQQASSQAGKRRRRRQI